MFSSPNPPSLFSEREIKRRLEFILSSITGFAEDPRNQNPLNNSEIEELAEAIAKNAEVQFHSISGKGTISQHQLELLYNSLTDEAKAKITESHLQDMIEDGFGFLPNFSPFVFYSILTATTLTSALIGIYIIWKTPPSPRQTPVPASASPTLAEPSPLPFSEPMVTQKQAAARKINPAKAKNGPADQQPAKSPATTKTAAAEQPARKKPPLESTTTGANKPSEIKYFSIASLPTDQSGNIVPPTGFPLDLIYSEGPKTGQKIDIAFRNRLIIAATLQGINWNDTTQSSAWLNKLLEQISEVENDLEKKDPEKKFKRYIVLYLPFQVEGNKSFKQDMQNWIKALKVGNPNLDFSHTDPISSSMIKRPAAGTRTVSRILIGISAGTGNELSVLTNSVNENGLQLVVGGKNTFITSIRTGVDNTNPLSTQILFRGSSNSGGAFILK
jgi:hypothetical protein